MARRLPHRPAFWGRLRDDIYMAWPGVTGSNDSPPFHDSAGEMTEMTRLK